jgi:hypothetical protein
MFVHICLPGSSGIADGKRQTRDQQSAAALGLPPRIRDEDGDVAMLEPDDVVGEETAVGDIFGRQTPQDLVYPVEMAKLARLRMASTPVHFLVLRC